MENVLSIEKTWYDDKVQLKVNIKRVEKNMLSIFLLFILIMGFLVGLKRGLIMQIVNLVGFIIAFISAMIYYDQLAPKLTLWIPYPILGDTSNMQLIFDVVNLEAGYYRAISFLIIFFFVKIIIRIIGSMLDFLASVPVVKHLNIWAGGILGVVEVYLITFLILSILGTLQISFVQESLNNSAVAKFIIENTPIFSKQLKEMWLLYVAS